MNGRRGAKLGGILSGASVAIMGDDTTGSSRVCGSWIESPLALDPLQPPAHPRAAGEVEQGDQAKHKPAHGALLTKWCTEPAASRAHQVSQSA